MLQRQFRMFIVHGMRRCHIHQIHVRVADQFLIRAVCLRKSLLFRKSLRTGQLPRAHRIGFHVFSSFLQAAHRRRHRPGDIACSQDCYSHFHFLSPFSPRKFFTKPLVKLYYRSAANASRFMGLGGRNPPGAGGLRVWRAAATMWKI